MALLTKPQFYYGHVINLNTNASLDFDEGGPEIQATLNPGDYTLTEFLIEIIRALNAVGALTYNGSVNRTTGVLTITATGSFRFRFGTGTRFGTSVGPLMGFAASNTASAASQTGTLRSGFIYRPQALVDNHVSADNFQEQTDAVVNESASGRVQVVRFGVTKFHEFEIVLATSKSIRSIQTTIEQNLTGEADLRAFMQSATTKAVMEYMPDRINPNTFDKVLLESTPGNRSGVGYRLQELKGTPGYFSTGVCRYRVVED